MLNLKDVEVGDLVLGFHADPEVLDCIYFILKHKGFSDDGTVANLIVSNGYQWFDDIFSFTDNQWWTWELQKRAKKS